MLKHELLRAYKNKFFYLSIVLGILVGVLGLFSYYSDISYFKINSELSSISAYEAWLYLLSLGSGAIYRLIVPLLVALPFVDTYLTDRKSGYINYVFTRTLYKKYFFSKIIANGLVGGTTVVITYFVWLIISIVLFPANLPKTSLNYIPSGLLGELYPSNPLLYIIFLNILGFIFGSIFSILGLSSSVLFKNKFIVTGFPFILYLSLIVISQILKINFLFPIIFITPYETSIGNLTNILLGYMIILILICVLLFKLFKKDQGDIL